MSDLYKEETDFKELNNKFLKRPAAITIRKPLLTDDEMSDVLTRLLLNYVPPTYTKPYYKQTASGSLAVRALLKLDAENVQCLDKATSAACSLFSPDFYEKQFALCDEPQIVKWSDNVFFTSPYTKDSGLSDSNEGAAIFGIQSLVSRMDYGLIGDVLTFAPNINEQRLEQEMALANIPTEEKELYRKERDSKGFFNVTMLLFDKADHDYLNRNTKTQQTQAPLLVKHPFCFKGNALPTSDGRQRVAYDPAKRESKDGIVGDEKWITKDLIKKAFGRLPDFPIICYKWTFRLKESTLLTIAPSAGTLKEITTQVSRLSAQRLASRLKLLLPQAVNSLMIKTGDKKNIEANCKAIIDNFDSQNFDINTRVKELRNIFTRLSKETMQDKVTQAKKFLRLPTNASINKGSTHADEHSTKKSVSVIKSALSTLTNIISPLNTIGTVVSDAILVRAKAVPCADTFLSVFDAYDKESSGNVIDFVKVKTFNNSTPIPMLEFTKKAEERIKALQKEAKIKVETRQYVTTEKPVQMSNIDFKVRYYSVLAKKVKEKLEKYKYFLDEKIMQFPLAEDLAIMEEIISTAKTAQEGSPATNAADVVASKGKDTLDGMYDSEKQLYIKYAERLFFSSMSGLFITSQALTKTSVNAPVWNSAASYSDFAKTVTDTTQPDGLDFKNYSVDQILTKLIATVQNKDLISVRIGKVTQGISTASISLKNDKEKYNFDRSDVINRGALCIEPMDKISIFLPDYNDQLHCVFSGFITKATASNRSGYHQLNISAACNLKYLKLNRTNTKPSTTRAENGNKAVTAFAMPDRFYKSLENYLLGIFSESLTHIYCQPKNTSNLIGTTTVNTKKLYTDNEVVQTYKDVFNISDLYTIVDVAVKDEMVVQTLGDREVEVTTSVTIESHDGQTIESIKGSDPTIVSVEQTAKRGTYSYDATLISTTVDPQIAFTAHPTGMYTVEHDTYKITRKVPTGYQTVNIVNKNKQVVLGSRRQVLFSDPLYNYLWYRATSKCGGVENTFIETNQWDLLQDYVDTETIKQTDPSMDVTRKTTPGITPLWECLQQKNRCSYLVYKQRSKGTLTLDASEASADDRELVAAITGTAQPTYRLENMSPAIQFSNWKPNLTLITEIADRLSFLYYTDSTGVVRFTPYNFDLLPLNTNDFTSNKINTEAMLLHRTAKTLETEDNPLILKKQYITDYNKTNDESKIVNWLQVSGEWVVGKPEFTKELIIDPVLINKYGVRAANTRSVLGIQNAKGAHTSVALRAYGNSWLDRQNKRVLSADISGLYDARMDINRTYYIPHDEMMYFCEGLAINYTAGQTCTYTMTATFGRQPIMDITKYVLLGNASANKECLIGNASLQTNTEFSNKLLELFITENKITPSIYMQYSALLGNKNPVTLSVGSLLEEISLLVNKIQSKAVSSDETCNAGVCCYNGYLWNGISSISIEELMYNYASFYGPQAAASFVSASGINDSLIKSLTSFIKVERGFNYSDQANNALNLYHREIPTIDSAYGAPPYLMTSSWDWKDLETAIVASRKVE